MAAHVPERMCVVCRTHLPKIKARRYGLNTNQQVEYDKTGTLPGRGVYVCSQNCYDKIHRGLLPLLTKSKKREKV